MSKTLAELVSHLGLKTVLPSSAAESRVHGLATLATAEAGQVAFLANRQYLSKLADTRALAVLLKPEFADACPVIALACADPYAAYARASQLFSPDRTRLIFGEAALDVGPAISRSATISTSAVIGENVFVGPNVCIGDGVVIGSGSRVAAGSFIGAGSRLGEDCIIYPQVSIYHDVHVGDRCIVHSHAVIGSDGFGFAPSAQGMIKIEQLGGVRIGNDVEVGAGTTIDRGALEHTRIGHGAKLDNQIQIAHNVQIGDHTVLAACVGISGSTRVGSRCMIGGGVGIAGHLTIADDVHFTGMTLVTRDITEPGVYSSGTAVEPNAQWRKNVARFRNLDSHIRTLKSHELKISVLESKSAVKGTDSN